jgi:hypothetical protein
MILMTARLTRHRLNNIPSFKEPPEDESPLRGVHSDVSSQLASRFNMDNLELASPIATLRSLGALDGKGTSGLSAFDPIVRGVISVQEAQEAFAV